MPSWGRPSRRRELEYGRSGVGRRKGGAWEREREHAYWQHAGARVQELDTDDQGIGGYDLAKRRFASDPLKFTGIDLAPKPTQGRRAYAYDTDSGSGSSSDDGSERGTAMQVALREKEEALVQSALARIRRAQEKGKREVKLDPEELEALETRRKRLQEEAKQAEAASKAERKRRKDNMVTIQLPLPPMTAPSDQALASSKPNKKKKGRHSDPAPAAAASNSSAPSLLALDGAGQLAYPPLTAYPTRGSPQRPRSRSHLMAHPRPASSSSTSSRRPLPDEEEWDPRRSRRSSVASSMASIDPYDYQIVSSTEALHSIPGGFTASPSAARRAVSGPSDVSYSSVRRSLPGATTSASTGLTSSYSDPMLPTVRRSKRKTKKTEYTELIEHSESESGSDVSEDLDGGVKVFAEEKALDKEREREREREKERDKDRKTIPSRKPVGGGNKKKGER